MKTIALLGLGSVAVLAACASGRPIVGQMERTPETFSGSIVGAGYREGTGQLMLRSSTSAICRGNFVYISRRRGDGVLNCDDGRSGSFHVAAVNANGSGYGDLNGQRYTFTFVSTE